MRQLDFTKSINPKYRFNCVGGLFDDREYYAILDLPIKKRVRGHLRAAVRARADLLHPSLPSCVYLIFPPI